MIRDARNIFDCKNFKFGFNALVPIPKYSVVRSSDSYMPKTGYQTSKQEDLRRHVVYSIETTTHPSQFTTQYYGSLNFFSKVYCFKKLQLQWFKLCLISIIYKFGSLEKMIQERIST